MSYGLQTTDASGNVVIRVTDRLTRFVATSSVYINASSSGTAYADISVSGMTTDGTWVAVADHQCAGCQVYDGFVRVTLGNFEATTVTITILRV